MAAAEALVAERGVTDVTVAQITDAAGQRNAAAVHYHFGGRDGLLDAVLERHHTEIDQHRFARLAERDDWDLAGLVELIVDPLVARLETDSGRAFLRILADRFVRGGHVGANLAESMNAIAEHVADLVPQSAPEVGAERARLATTMITVRLGQEATGAAATDPATLRAVLVDAVTAVLTLSPTS